MSQIYKAHRTACYIACCIVQNVLRKMQNCNSSGFLAPHNGIQFIPLDIGYLPS